jgi:hypothetical protein
MEWFRTRSSFHGSNLVLRRGKEVIEKTRMSTEKTNGVLTLSRTRQSFLPGVPERQVGLGSQVQPLRHPGQRHRPFPTQTQGHFEHGWLIVGEEGERPNSKR